MKNHQNQSGLPVNQLGLESNIPIDNELHVINPLDGNRINAPIIWTICIHVAIIAFVIYTNLIPNIIQQPVVETILYTPDDLVKLQSDIEANRVTVAAQAMKSDGDDSNSDTEAQSKLNKQKNSNTAVNANKLSVPTKTISPEMQAINKSIAERQRQFDEAMKRSSNKLDREAQKEKQQRAEAIQKNQRETQKLIEEFKQAESKLIKEEDSNIEEEEPLSFEELKENFEKLKEATENLEELQQNKKPKKKQPEKEKIIRKSMGVGQSQTSRSRHTNGHAPTTRGTKVPKVNVEAAIATKIRRNLAPPEGSKGFTSVVTIHVDSVGFVKNATARGENLALNDASKQAVYNSSPLPTLGSNRRTFIVKLNGR